MSHRVDLPPDSPASGDGLKLGGWWHATEEPGRLVCDLCPRACALRPGDRGFCFVRENRDGQMLLTTYGRSTGFCVDPIEKKPLNHFYPGSSVLSFGTAGCNLGCKFCQNWSISKSREIERLSEVATPEAIAEAARRLECRSVAFTYNDPVIWAEYAIDTAKACHAAGVKTVAVTAGYITPQARGPFYEFMDAANVDLKGFTEEFYQHLTLSHLEPVLDTLRWLKRETDVWFEITNLVIPQANDSPDEFRRMCDWVLTNLGPDVPLHFTAFHPDFRLRDRGRTPAETLLAAHEIARSMGLHYAYVGNVQSPREQSTWCPGCRNLLIERQGYEVRTFKITSGACEHCGRAIAGRFDDAPGTWGSRRLPVQIAAFQEPSKREPVMIQTKLPAASSAVEFDSSRLSASQRQSVFTGVCKMVAAAVAGQPLELAEAELGGVATDRVLGAFVSLKRRGRLRSCCGFLGQMTPLREALVHAAGRTSNDDHRFPPVSASELAYLDLEIWLLSNLRPVAAQGVNRRDAIEIGRHGLQISRGEARGLLLPGVAVDGGFDADQFLEHVCIKAGLPPTAWREGDTVLATFEGHEIAGAWADAQLPAPAAAAAPLTTADVAALAEFCRGNILAILRGATPSYYAFGASDANVQGLAARLTAPETELSSAFKLALRHTLPVQSTLYGMAETFAQAIARRRLSDDRLNQLRLELVICYDAALHGSADAPDLQGFDPARRALLVTEGGSACLAHDTHSTAENLLTEALEAAGIVAPEASQTHSLAVVTNASRLIAAQRPQPQAGPRIRPAAQAGRFYPADPAALSAMVDGLCDGPAPEPADWPAVMVPHAGLVYSGRIAADTLRRVRIPETVLVLGPKHTPHGVRWSVAPHETWSIPGATLDSDPSLARDLTQAIPGLQLDAAAHQQEHAIEVELPLLARLAPHSRVLGLAIGGGSLAACMQFAEGLARVLRDRPGRTLLVISSDMNHFASDAENRRLDEIALAAMETLDPATLHQTVTRQHISMCGLLPAVIVLQTLRELGQVSRSQRVGYATSADVTGDTSRVVGYAGMLLG